MTSIATRAAASVLIIEDNVDLCENLAEIFERQGFRALAAGTAREALEAAAATPPDVALIDLNLPDGRGIDLVLSLRRTSPETAAVILTGNASLESAVEAVNRGAYAYLLKGGRIEDLVATVERAAEKVRLEREKTRLERELREERNFSRAIVSNAALGIAVLAPDGHVLELNRHVRDMLGDAGAAAASDRAAIVRLGRDESARLALEEALAGRRRLRESLEVEVVRSDGSSRIWKISTSTVARDLRENDAIVAVFADVTQERELQRQVLQASRLAAIGEMAARVAHEIRNPLAGIAGAIRVLSHGALGDAKREAFGRELLVLVGRLNSFVEDLLLYARPLRIAKAPVPLLDVLEPIRRLLREHPMVRGVALESEDRLGRPLRIDRHHFGMALQNLILNAAQAQRGKGRIRIEAAAAEGGGTLVVVIDEGPGIDAAILPRLFEAFVTTRVEGTGLGLSTSKRIVEAHGGSIAAQNRPEGGARFEIRLPE